MRLERIKQKIEVWLIISACLIYCSAIAASPWVLLWWLFFGQMKN